MLAVKRFAAGLSALLLLVAATPAFSADTAPDAHKLELAKRVFAAMHMEQMMGGMMRQMMPAMQAQMAKGGLGAMSAEQQQALSEATAESMQVMMARMQDMMAPVYAETFTEKQLQDLVTFYEGPTAQAMLAKQPEIAAKMMPAIIQMMPEMMEDMHRRMCSKVDCTKLALPPASPKS